MDQIGMNSTRVPAVSMSLTLDNLEEYVNYTILVRAITAVGGGPYSNPITRLTQEAGVYAVFTHYTAASAVSS